jgi:hypothetical protein
MAKPVLALGRLLFGEDRGKAVSLNLLISSSEWPGSGTSCG